ncbi:protein FAN isoform X1 [Diachasma alloeum]|uniref:protein FAN isoform X1 n=2 Tax=Diachasma alloeum TaxID=454923 RepID=UPI0007384B54|nr:protein FAN isoform X1 [Diachasma alloeum]
MEKERFTMLLLEPGEIFFEDYSVRMKLEDDSDKERSQWMDGRLKLCSKSLVFVNKDINWPLLKLQFKEIVSVESTTIREIGSVLSAVCKQYTEMLKGNILEPYKFVHKSARFYISFNYANPEDCLPQIMQLLRAATLPTAEHNAMIMTIVHSRQSRFSFDTSWLEDLYEEIIFEVQANKIQPLIVNPGRVLLTNSRIYFQPYNNLDQHPVLKINLKTVKSVLKRRFLLRQVGLEIKWLKLPESRVECLFLSVKNQEDRDRLYDNLMRQSVLQLETVPQNQMTIQWQNRGLSNYDYLLYVNSLADRTFHDLTQYPVMPWILQDYTSPNLDLNDPKNYRDLTKPIGALEPDRLERLKERYQEMSHNKFLYGSHYSAPGFVLFYLVRKYPQYMLCLQNGRFDHPDRMFNNVADVWKNVLANMSDFKELVPEFYDTSNGGDFLVNKYGIDFGYRYNGVKVGDVQLPPWAEGPADFVQKLRSALESDYVSQNLHHWIDLIFGYKQRGVEAEKADNVFFHLCYEGAVDLDTIQDINDRHGMEVQIMEFGQIPKQVFTLPHPSRFASAASLSCDIPLSCPLIVSGGQRISKESSTFELKQSVIFPSHKETISTIIQMNGDGSDIASVGHDGVLKIYSLTNQKLTRSISLSNLPLSSCIFYQTKSGQNVLVVGSWDNSLIFYDVEFGRIIDVLTGHEDAVSSLAWSPSRNIIVSGSWDCTIKIWHSYVSGLKIKLQESLIAQLDHESKITCLSISRDERLLASGTEDGEICVWNMDSYDLEFSVKGHGGKVTATTFDSECKNIIACTNDKTINVFDAKTSTRIYSTLLEDGPTVLSWSGSILLVGDDKGNVNLWDSQEATFLAKTLCHDGPLTAITTTIDNNKIITGGNDRRIIVWNCD